MGGKTPAGLKPCEDGDALTEHFATGSQGKIHPSLPEFGCSFFPFILFPLKNPHWISLFPRLSSSCPKISQALLKAPAGPSGDVLSPAVLLPWKMEPDPAAPCKDREQGERRELHQT